MADQEAAYDKDILFAKPEVLDKWIVAFVLPGPTGLFLFLAIPCAFSQRRCATFAGRWRTSAINLKLGGLILVFAILPFSAFLFVSLMDAS